MPVDLARVMRLVCFALCIPLRGRDSEANWYPEPMEYAAAVPNAVLIFILGIVYAPIAPLVPIFATFYFLVAVRVSRVQLVYVKLQPFDSRGSLWPAVSSRVILGLLLAHLTLLGVFILKFGPAQAPLVLPLLPITVGAHYHLKWRYGRAFSAIPRDVSLGLDAQYPAADPAKEVALYTPPALSSDFNETSDRV